LSQLTAAGIGPGYQVTYNEWMQVDPTLQVGGVPTRVLLGMEEVWQTLSTQTPQSGHSQFQSFGMYTANGGACLVVPEQCGAAMAKDGTVFAGLQDNGQLKIAPDGKQFATYVGDGIYALVNPDNSMEAWGELPQTPVYFTTDGGQTWTESVPGLTDADFVAP